MIFIWYVLYAFYLFFEVINVLPSCLDLCEYLYTIILNSLSGKLHTLLYLSWFLEIYLALFFGTYSLFSSYSLILCVGFCALNNTPTSLQDWTCIRENFHPFIWPEISKCLSICCCSLDYYLCFYSPLELRICYILSVPQKWYDRR